MEITQVILIGFVLYSSRVASLKKTSPKLTKYYNFLSISILGWAMVVQALSASNFIEGLILMTYGIWMLSLLRIFESKHSKSYVKMITYRDSKYFFVLSLFLLLLSGLGLNISKFAYDQWTLLFSCLIFLSVMISLMKYRIHRNPRVQKDFRTVTLAIPARNENHALKQSLEAALVSNYPKLEILVLDDCSQDSTGDMIRGFAHDGVRFVQGEKPSASWIGKNQSYKTLLEQASGEIIVFCGVDVHLSVDSISQLVKYLEDNNLKMLSVLPTRGATDFVSHVFQPIRHLWQFVVPRFLTSQPAAISSCWVVERQALINKGGFDSISNSINPEAQLASQFHAINSYEYLLADPELGLTTRKRPSSQIDTAVRTLYPTLGRSFALSWFAVLTLMILFVGPFVSLAWAVINSSDITLALLSVLFLTLSHLVILAKVAPGALLSGFITLPLAMMIQVAVIVVSAYKYEFGKVIWKGRNVCEVNPLPSNVLSDSGSK